MFEVRDGKRDFWDLVAASLPGKSIILGNVSMLTTTQATVIITCLPPPSVRKSPFGFLPSHAICDSRLSAQGDEGSTLGA